jgi:hypothetical protein
MGSCQTVPVNESADPRRVGTDPDGVKFIAVSFSRWPTPTVLRTPRTYTLGHVVLKYIAVGAVDFDRSGEIAW